MYLYDLGEQPWWLTQVIYHTLPRLGREALVLCWPDQPYMCLGFSQDIAEIDLAFCRERGLPVFRRAVGGGLVYLDSHQVFFQVMMRRDRLPARVDALYRTLLEPARQALEDLGLEAAFRPAADLTVGGRKVSGNGGGEIAGHAVVVGNLLLDFNFDAMAGALAAPTPHFRERARALMEERLTTLGRELGHLPARQQVAEALKRRYESALGPFEPGSLDPRLLSAMSEVREKMATPAWPDFERRPGPERAVKIAEGCYLRHAAVGEGMTVTWVEDEGRLRDVRIDHQKVGG